MPPRKSTESGLTTPAVVAVLFLAVAGAAVAGAAVQSQSAPSGDEILENVERTYENAESVTGTANVTVENETRSTTAQVEFAYAEPNRTRIAVTHEGRTMLLGTNGTVAWAYDPTTTQVRVWGEEDRAAMRERVETKMDDTRYEAANPNATWSEENYTATRTGTETVAGVEAAVVELEPANESRHGQMTLWVDTGNWTVVRQRVAVGDNETVATFRDVRFNVSVHASTFEPPTDEAADLPSATQTRYDSFDAAQSNTSLSLPTLGDAAFEGATVTDARGETTVAQRYATGDDSALLVTSTASDLPMEAGGANATTVDVAGQTATVTTLRGQTVVAWETDGLTHAVVADASQETVVSLAESVRTEA
jgi:outer membrane lipoprotein-sorting protein